MTRTRNGLRGAVAALVMLVVAATASSAAAQDPYDKVRDFWTLHGVPVQVQDELVEELRTTGTVDAVREGAEPVSIVTRTSGGAQVTVATFADGSISVTTLDQPKPPGSGSVGTLASISGCQTTSGSGFVTYKDCVVSADNGIFRIGFKVTYERYSGAYAKIIRSGSAQAKSGTGTITDPTRTLWRPQSSVTQQAVVKYHSDYTAWSNGTQQDVYLGFWLTYNGTASTSTS